MHLARIGVYVEWIKLQGRQLCQNFTSLANSFYSSRKIYFPPSTGTFTQGAWTTWKQSGSHKCHLICKNGAKYGKLYQVCCSTISAHVPRTDNRYNKQYLTCMRYFTFSFSLSEWRPFFFQWGNRCTTGRMCWAPPIMKKRRRGEYGAYLPLWENFQKISKSYRTFVNVLSANSKPLR